MGSYRMRPPYLFPPRGDFGNGTVLQRMLLGAGALLCLAATPELADPGYLGRPLKAQAEPPTAPQDPIVAPTSSTPALLTWGERFEVTVLLPAGADPRAPDDWVMALTTRTKNHQGEMVGQPVGMRFVVAVEELRRGAAENTTVLSARLSAHPPREVYHLELAGPSGIRGRRLFAVRVLGGPERAQSFRLALIGDHQLRDPSTHFIGANQNNRSYPRRSEDDAESMLLQQVQELVFLDPDFLLHLGDLVFGVDYREEYPATLAHWWSGGVAGYLVPGNHDGLAHYELALKKGWWVEALKSVRCAKYLLKGEVTAAAVFRLLLCLLGDLKKILFEDLTQDGLDYWRRLLGPTDFSFDLGGFHFVGLNSYSGSAERRHAFVLGLGFLGVDLGAAPVDNYGGTLDDAQLRWLEGDLQRARSRNQTVVLFLHHDPRGNRELSFGRCYHENQPFPTEPLGLRKFQEWNYDGPEWDSDPGDARGVESQTANSAVALLRLIARQVDYVASGHLHHDLDTVVEAGEELVLGSGIRASRKVHFIRVTTASANPETDEDYWGYRLIRAEGGRLADLSYYPAWGWKSLPAGNFWVTGSGVPGPGFDLDRGTRPLFVVYSGLPAPISGLLRAYLPDAPEGYRFPESGGEARLVDLGRGEGGMNVYYLRVSVPAVRSGVVPPPKGEEEQVHIRVQRACGNRAPVADFRLEPKVPTGEQIGLDGSASQDPEGRPLVQYIWDFGDGAGARGPVVSHTYRQAGRYLVSLTAVDDCGAFARHATTHSVLPAPGCSFGGTACAATSTALVVFALVLLAWRLGRRRPE